MWPCHGPQVYKMDKPAYSGEFWQSEKKRRIERERERERERKRDWKIMANYRL